MTNIPAPDSHPEAKQRRSQRLLVQIPVIVCAMPSDPQPFEEKTTTLVVNAHGGLVLLAAKVENGQRLKLSLPSTKEARTCRVVYQGPGREGRLKIGIEFDSAAPDFWGIHFPPQDWAPTHPEAKGSPTR